MPWRYDDPPPRDPSSLLHPVNGFAADDVRRALGLSPVARVEDLERNVARLQRLLAVTLDLFRGFDLQYGVNGSVSPQPRTGKVELNSNDSSILIDPQPYERAHVVNFTVAPANLCFPQCSSARTGAGLGGVESFDPLLWLKVCGTIAGVKKCYAIPAWLCGTGSGCGV